MSKQQKMVSISPDFTIQDMETDKIIYKGDRRYGGTKFYLLLQDVLTEKQMGNWIDGGHFDFKISVEKYELIINQQNNE